MNGIARKSSWIALLALLLAAPGRADAGPGALSFGGSVDGNVLATAPARDGTGDYYVAGTFVGQMTVGGTTLQSGTQNKLYVARLTYEGEPVWVRMPATSGNTGFGSFCCAHNGGTTLKMDTDESGNAYVAGQFFGTINFPGATLSSSDGNTSYVAKISASGEWAWARGIKSTSLSIGALAVADDSRGPSARIYVDLGGFFGGPGAGVVSATFGSIVLSPGHPTYNPAGDGFVARLDGNGTWSWAQKMGALTDGLNPAQNFDAGASIRAITNDPSGNVYAIGNMVVGARFFGLPSQIGSANPMIQTQNLFTGRIGPTGQWSWVTVGGRTATSPAAPSTDAIARDRGTGDLFVTGRFNSSAYINDPNVPYTTGKSGSVYIASLTTSGAWRWVSIAPDTNLYPGCGCLVSRMQTDSAGGLYLTGNFRTPIAFSGDPNDPSNPLRLDPPPPVTSPPYGNDAEVWIAKASAGFSGVTWTWARSGGQSHPNSGFDYAFDLVLDDFGFATVVGMLNKHFWNSDPEWVTYPATFGPDVLPPIGTQSFGYMVKLDAQGNWLRGDVTIGSPIYPPTGALSLAPDTQLLGGPPGVEAATAFLWCQACPNPSRPSNPGAAFVLAPISGFLRWKTSTDPANANRIPQLVLGKFPSDPQIHVAGVPVDLEAGQSDVIFGSLVYTSSSGASAENKIFTASNLGYSVLLYSDGPVLNPSQHPVVFTVARTVAWNESDCTIQPNCLSEAQWPIGAKITEASHQDPTGRNGYVYFERAAYDGYGADRAYDRSTRTGPILPVNEDLAATDDDLVVIWFRTNAVTGIAWPVKPVRYDAVWPASPRQIAIANQLGSDAFGQPVLDPAAFPSKRIYAQPDPARAGYNPNDEHALFAPSNSGTGFDALFALRSDLTAASQPYVLLKWRHPGTLPSPSDDEWRIDVYQVTPGTFSYTGTAGQVIQPPYPLGLLGECSTAPSASYGTGTPLFRDYKGTFWARSGPRSVGLPDNVVHLYYFYPLQLGFAYDIDGDGADEAAAGTCLPWLDRLGTIGTPIQTVRTIAWPVNAPVLAVGETLLTPKNGLPDIKNQASAKILYDESDPAEADPDIALAQLIDPLSERTVALDALPSGVATDIDGARTVITGNTAGTLKLPYHLRVRLGYDRAQKQLGFRGWFDNTGDFLSGDPLLLPNVLTSGERDELLALSSDAAWQDAVDALYHRTRNPQELDLDGAGEADEAFLIGLQDGNGATAPDVAAPLELFGLQGALTAGRRQKAGALATGYVTLAFNDDIRLSPSPVSLSVIRVDCLRDGSNNVLGPFQGQIQAIRPDNVFDELMTLRHSGDFGGDPESLDYQWFYQPADGNQPAPPDANTPGTGPFGSWLTLVAGNPGDPNQVNGRNSVTVGTTPSVLSLSDNWYIVRYRGYPACGNATGYSLWAGDPAGRPLTPRAKLVEGWIKRVVAGLNPFDSTISDFHKAAPNTFASMLIQLGTRYEGDIALSSNPANLLGIRLIAAYETALRRALGLSIDAGLNYGPANDALLNLSGRLADFYLLLGNEAYSDALDPTIGYSTQSGTLGSLAPAVFAFGNQLASLLDEELGLLRGRDQGGASPAYNRLLWNFTNGDGQVAYVQAYNLSDQNTDGKLDVTDASILFPQSHGDAWGHYLTALGYYYRLLRHPSFTWLPRTEFVNIAGQAIEVDYLDERKFARAAAAKANSGAEILDLTYRHAYVEDPSGQWQGYQDTDTQRAWGVTEWARRAGQGAYLDLAVASALLPATDPNPAHTGIQKVDRTTVTELAEVASGLQLLQHRMDQADQGLNPVGIAKGAIPFDIDPSLLSGAAGIAAKSHFEQIYDRALAALRSAVKTFDNANQLSQMLRRNQDSIDDFRRNVQDQERDYRNRLIETFGSPYPEDIGPGGIYPQGYDGPDLYHYLYVDATELTGSSASTEAFTAYFTPVAGEPGNFFPGAADLGDALPSSPVLAVPFTISTDGFGIVKPPGWTGKRRSPGQLQALLSDVHRNRAIYEQLMADYTNHIGGVADQLALMKLRFDTDASRIEILRRQRGTVSSLNSEIAAHRSAAGIMHGLSQITHGIADAAVEAFPRVVGLAYDATSGLRYGVKAAAIAATIGLEAGAGIEGGAANRKQDSKDVIQLDTDIELLLETNNFEEQQALAELKGLIGAEPGLRLAVYTQEEVVRQSLAAYSSKLAEGERLIQELTVFRQRTASDVSEYRYQDMAFRVFRNDALQKYRAAFDLAARYAYLAATAYDYETNLLGSSSQAGRRFLTDIVKFRSLGQVIDGEPIPGSRGLADPLARLKANFDVLKGQLGFNNPQLENNGFSLRRELFRILASDDAAWRARLQSARVADLNALPEFRKYCRPFAPAAAGAQPGLVLEFGTTVTYGKNFFAWPLGGGDAAYDATHFATKVRSVGLALPGYDDVRLSRTPRAYLVPVGLDVLRSPTGDTLATREFKVIDQAVPPPFPVGDTDLANPGWIPLTDSLPEALGSVRRHATFRAYAQDPDDLSFNPLSIATENRLVGRSVWNTRWLLIIPGATLLADPDEGLDSFVLGAPIPGSPGTRDGNGVQDIRLFFTTYAYTGQ